MARRRWLLIGFVTVLVCGFLWVSSDRLSLSFITTGIVSERSGGTNVVGGEVTLNTSSAPRPSTTESAPSSSAASERVKGENSAPVEQHVSPLVPGNDSLPYSGWLKEKEELQKEEWVVKLHSYLLTLNKGISPHVNTVFGDYKHKRLVLNWITAAVNLIHPPLHNVLVVSLDNFLCDDLAKRSLPVACVSVSIDAVFNDKKLDSWLKGLMVRAVLLRVINYWGYDVASYDCDAVLLKNPQVLYDKRPDTHIFSAAGTYPNDVSGKWGFALCAGTVVFKASPATEALWKHVSTHPEILDEQVLINTVLVEMKTVWQKRTSAKTMCSVKEGWEGRGENDIRIYVFPARISCRAGCCRSSMSRGSLYVFHPISSKTDMGSKETVLKRMKAWFLHEG